MDARTDERTEKIMLLSHTFTMRGSDVASLVEFHLHGGLGEDNLTDRQTDDGRTEGWTHAKILLSHTLTMRGRDVASLVEFHTVI